MKHKDHSDAGASGGRPTTRLTPLDVQQKEFRVSFRGYNEREVDEFLDRVTEELQRYEAELMRVRSDRASADPSTLDVDAESERILREARERADAIVREAEARAAGIPTASGSDARAVVAPYLNREREFLQSLGTLVQDHAQTIKTMVEEARRRTEEASASAAEPVTPAAVAPSASERTVAAASPENRDVASPAETRADDATQTQADDSTQTRPASSPDPGDRSEGAPADGPEPDSGGDEVVVVAAEEETVPAGAERPRDEREPEGARSLRELFWGED